MLKAFYFKPLWFYITTILLDFNFTLLRAENVIENTLYKDNKLYKITNH